jgi:choline-glycine betaine transporter
VVLSATIVVSLPLLVVGVMMGASLVGQLREDLDRRDREAAKPVIGRLAG